MAALLAAAVVAAHEGHGDPALQTSGDPDHHAPDHGQVQVSPDGAAPGQAEVKSAVSEAASAPAAVPAPDEAVLPGRGTATGDGKLFFPFVYSSTLTVFSIASVTSTVPLYCFKSVNGTGTACTGRRRRRRRSSRLSYPRELEAPVHAAALQPSVGEHRADPTAPDDSRLVLTSWITVVSSLTSVSTVTTYGTTVSLDLLCSIGGTTYLPLCGAK